MHRIRGLDSLRFVCAFWVLLSHLALPCFVDSLSDGGLFSKIATAFLNNAFVGVCAVIAFFVISGICIHISHAQDLRIRSLKEYFLRRFVRIVPPLLAAAALGCFLNVNLHNSILWSLYCELWYYALYPLLLMLRRRSESWTGILSASFLGALVVMISHSNAQNFHTPGIWLTWILGLPCWLMGCIIAERWLKGNVLVCGRIWPWRLLIWAASVGCSFLRFHSPIGYVWTLPVFGIGVAFWISKEIANFRRRSTVRILEWFGGWSFSLYLTHLIGFSVAGSITEDSGETLIWLFNISCALGLSYLFALSVEFPSHRLAKAAARHFR